MSNASAESKKIQVFLIGDELSLALTIIKYLETHSNEIELLKWTKTGKEGISKAKKLNPHIVLIDSMMPDINSIEVVRIIRANAPNSKIISMSMSNDPTWIMKSLDAGADGYVSLPLVADNLYNQIHNLYHHTGVSMKEYLDSQKGL